MTKVAQKTAKIINLPYYLLHFIKKNPLFDVDLFSRTFDMESPIRQNLWVDAKLSFEEIKIVFDKKNSELKPKL